MKFKLNYVLKFKILIVNMFPNKWWSYLKEMKYLERFRCWWLLTNRKLVSRVCSEVWAQLAVANWKEINMSEEMSLSVGQLVPPVTGRPSLGHNNNSGPPGGGPHIDASHCHFIDYNYDLISALICCMYIIFGMVYSLFGKTYFIFSLLCFDFVMSVKSEPLFQVIVASKLSCSLLASRSAL